MEKNAPAIPIPICATARSFTDGCVVLLTGIFMAAPVYGFLGGVFYLFTGKVAVEETLLAFCFLALFLALFSVYRISVSTEGLQLQRVLGSPRFVKWDDVTGIEPVSFFKYFLRTLMMPNQGSWSFSSQGVYRISWGSGCCYYAPADPAFFERVMTLARQGDSTFSEILGASGSLDRVFEWKRLRPSVVFHGAVDAFLFFLVCTSLIWRISSWPPEVMLFVGRAVVLILTAPLLGFAMGRLHRPNLLEGIVAAMLSVVVFQTIGAGFYIMWWGFAAYWKHNVFWSSPLASLFLAALVAWRAGRSSKEFTRVKRKLT